MLASVTSCLTKAQLLLRWLCSVTYTTYCYYVKSRMLCNAWHCLFVCLLATLLKNYWMDLHKNLTADILVHKEELIKFWKSSASRSGSTILLKDSSTLWDKAFFHNLAHISRGSDRIFIKILSQIYRWTRKSLLNFWSTVIRSPDPDMDSGSRPYSPWQMYAVCDCSLLNITYILFCTISNLSHIIGENSAIEWRYVHCESKKTAPFYFCNIFVKPSSILIIFGTCIPW